MQKEDSFYFLHARGVVFPPFHFTKLHDVTYPVPELLRTTVSWEMTRAVSVNALIYAINAAAINAIKYFNAINAT